MIGALAVIWIFFNILSGGNFLTPRNLWNLSVQSSSIAIMATGMVLIIVSRNIDLSVGSMLGFVGYTMAMVQVELAAQGPRPRATTSPTSGSSRSLVGHRPRRRHRRGPGLPRRLRRRPVVHRHPRRAARLARPHLPLRPGPDPRAARTRPSSCSAADPRARSATIGSWVLGVLACVGIVYTLWAGRRRRRRYGFPVRPAWAEAVIGGVGCAVVLGRRLGRQQLLRGRPRSPQCTEPASRPPGGIPTGVAFPVLIMLGVGLVMTYLATRRRFGRYVYAIGGNPDAAELGGINVRRTIMRTFVLMGILVAVSAAVQTARLNAAVTNLGVQNELDVISAAVIGGTSFAGGIGTIPGAILGAVVMQSLRSGMLLLNVDSPTQDVVVGMVLVAAVGFDSYLRRRAS